MPRPLAFLVPTLCFAGACDLAQGDHPLATLESKMPAGIPAQGQVGIVWLRYADMHLPAAAQVLDPSGALPDLELQVDAAPPASIADDWAGEQYSVGVVAVGTDGADLTVPTNWDGVELDQVVVYLPKDTTPGGANEGFLHGPQRAGFHVYSVKHLTAGERQTVLDCINALPDLGSGPDLPYAEVFQQCGGLSGDELEPIASDLATPFQLGNVVGASEVTLVNDLPDW